MVNVSKSEELFNEQNLNIIFDDTEHENTQPNSDHPTLVQTNSDHPNSDHPNSDHPTLVQLDSDQINFSEYMIDIIIFSLVIGIFVYTNKLSPRK